MTNEEQLHRIYGKQKRTLQRKKKKRIHNTGSRDEIWNALCEPHLWKVEEYKSIFPLLEF